MAPRYAQWICHIPTLIDDDLDNYSKFSPKYFLRNIYTLGELSRYKGVPSLRYGRALVFYVTAKTPKCNYSIMM